MAVKRRKKAVPSLLRKSKGTLYYNEKYLSASSQRGAMRKWGTAKRKAEK